MNGDLGGNDIGKNLLPIQNHGCSCRHTMFQSPELARIASIFPLKKHKFAAESAER
jgi:hypothetical protein